MTELFAGAVEQFAMLHNGKPLIVELYAASSPTYPWRVSCSRFTPGGREVRDVTEHANLRQARREFRRLRHHYRGADQNRSDRGRKTR